MNRARATLRTLVLPLLVLVAPLAVAQGDVAIAELPVTRVVLFTTGVGYFEHAGTVVGDQEIELRVATGHMDDLLQSLVLADLDGGTVRPVRYGARDPLGRVLGSFSLDLSGDPTLAQLLAQARGEGRRPAAGVVQGWMVEPVTAPEREVWIWGAGHVGRALVAVLAPLPGLRLTWIDTDAGRFPDLPAGVVQRIAARPADLVEEAPEAAEHLVLTFSHSLDLELCHRLLGHGFRTLGLIGSATKWARFRSRLAALGHPEARIARIRCPIGDPGLGKHPQAIAIGVAADLLGQRSAGQAKKERRG